jgi:hypothetical protein
MRQTDIFASFLFCISSTYWISSVGQEPRTVYKLCDHNRQIPMADQAGTPSKIFDSTTMRLVRLAAPMVRYGRPVKRTTRS